MTLRLLYLCEGTSDEGLKSHIERIGAEADTYVNVSPGRAPGHSVESKLQAERELSGSREARDVHDLAVIHRDSDGLDLRVRRREIERAIAAVWPGLSHIPVIPVRMTEAWLLDEQAIRQVANNPRGRVDLQLPKASKVEHISDPKKRLKETLALASEANGRRLRELNERFGRNRRRLLDMLDPHGPVSQVPSWQAFVGDLTEALLCAHQS